MNINANYNLRQLPNSGYVLESISGGKLIVLNKTAAYIWMLIKSGSSTIEQLQKEIMDKYQVDSKKAYEDLVLTTTHWLSIGIINP
ncbi:MAG: PqqD family protein [Duncaniella sp.]|nr:PqqD family protein [Duncaniella sp.]